MGHKGSTILHKDNIINYEASEVIRNCQKNYRKVRVNFQNNEHSTREKIFITNVLVILIL